jgi:hypothetical protein
MKRRLSELSPEVHRRAAELVASAIGEPDLPITDDFIRLVKIAAVASIAYGTAMGGTPDINDRMIGGMRG